MSLLSLSVAALLFASPVVDDEEPCLDEAKCPVSGKAVSEDASIAYKDATLYFCCPNCPTAFKNDTEKFEPKANAQLVATGQAEQTACPISGRATDPDATLTVQAVAVEFCCSNCQGKAEGTEGDEQITLIFANTAFEKAFKVKKKDDN